MRKLAFLAVLLGFAVGLMAQTPQPSQRLINARITTMKAEVERTRARLANLESQLAELEAQVKPAPGASPVNVPGPAEAPAPAKAETPATSPAKLGTIQDALNELPKELWPKQDEFSVVAKKRNDWINKRLMGKTFLHEAPLRDVGDKQASFGEVTVKVWGEFEIGISVGDGSRWSGAINYTPAELESLMALGKGAKVRMCITFSDDNAWRGGGVYVTSPRLLLDKK